MRHRIDTVVFGARCSLATQKQVVSAASLEAFGAELEARVEHTAHRGEAVDIVPMIDLRDGVADRSTRDHARKQPDWTFGDHWSGKPPPTGLDDHRSHHEDL